MFAHKEVNIYVYIFSLFCLLNDILYSIRMYITLRDRISVTTQSQTTSSEFSIKKNRLPLPKNFGLRMLKNDPFAATA